MDAIQTFISEIFSSAQMIALVTGVFTWFMANILTLILFAVKYCKLKSNEIKDRMLHEKTIEALTDEYKTSIEKITKIFNEKMDHLEETFGKKVDSVEEQRKEEIKKDTLDLQNAISQVKASLNITE